MSALLSHLRALYGDAVGQATFERLQAVISNCRSRVPTPRMIDVTQRDAILITYGDQVQTLGVPPLQTLADFCARHLAGILSGIHILPFYPYSSDDGFSVTDYRMVNPALGDWVDIERLGRNFRLMFDAVINHVSVKSEWFQRFLQDDPAYRDFFIVVPADADLDRVVRPRAQPLLTRFITPSGEKQVWTTFSADQVDLNYHNPEVLLEIVDTLLFYVAHHAEFIRLDAIAFLWKEPGTTCLNLPQTHRVVQVLRAVLDEIAPHVMLNTETNVPHAENISYFGDGTNEAQMVYNFALPPLVLHAFHTGNVDTLSRWARGITLPSARNTFFNFLASHDGIGLNPVRGILSDADIDAMVARTQTLGGLISHKNNPNGTTSPYELNINYFDALSDPSGAESVEIQVARFIAAQATMLSFIGVPGIYFHSLFGSRGWTEGVKQTGQNRTINREKCNLQSLERELADPVSRRHAVFRRYAQLLRVRAAHSAFHPNGRMQVLEAGSSIFAVERVAPDDREHVLCFQNVSNQTQPIPGDVFHEMGSPAVLRNLFTGEKVDITDSLHLAPLQTLWMA